MKEWLTELVQWAVDQGLDEKEVWIDDEGGGKATRRRALETLHKHAARIASTRRLSLDNIPDVGDGIRLGWLPRGVVALAYRMARIVQLVAAVFGHQNKDRKLVQEILLVMAIALRLPQLRSRMEQPGRRGTRDLAAAAGLGHPDKLAAAIEIEMIRRHHAFEVDPDRFSFAIEDAVQMMLLDAAGVAAAHYFDGMELTPQDVGEMDTQSFARAQLLLWLTIEMARSDGTFEQEHVRYIQRLAEHLGLPERERDALLKLPDGIDWNAYATYFPEKSERQGILECLLTMAFLDGGEHAVEIEFCNYAARQLGIDEYDAWDVQQEVQRALRP